MAYMKGIHSNTHLNSVYHTQLRCFIIWLKRHQVASSRALSFLLLLASAWVLGSLVWMPFLATDIAPWRATIRDDDGDTRTRLDVAAIKQRDLFGALTSETTVVTAKPTIQDAPKTTLSLTLVGVVQTVPDRLSLAIIANRDQQATYGVDETIEGTRATISAVYHDRVVLNNAGRSETLMLVDVPYESSASGQVSRRQSTVSSSDANDDMEPSSAESVDEIKQQLSEDPSQLSQYVKMSRVKRDGSIVGYRLRPGRSPALFQTLGLQSGDIATEINGIALSEADSVSQLMPLINQLSEINLTVERDGEPYEIYIQL
jgi:general secretion pathway protein C